MKFEINLIFLIKPVCYMTKKSRQKILRTKRAFEVKFKAFSIIFIKLSAAKNCLRHENAPLKIKCLGAKLCVAFLLL